MGQSINLSSVSKQSLLDSQPCVRAFRSKKFPKEFKQEMERFISRNTLPDCGRVPPNCFKAHLIKKANDFKFSKNKVESIKKLFKSKMGYNGYYLDSGKLRSV